MVHVYVYLWIQICIDKESRVLYGYEHWDSKHLNKLQSEALKKKSHKPTIARGANGIIYSAGCTRQGIAFLVF